MITKARNQLMSKRDLLRSAACSVCLLAAVLRPVGLFAEDHPKADPHCGTNAPAPLAGGVCCSNPQAMSVGSDQPMDVGLAIGQKAPSFMLKDQNGKDISLDEMLKKGPVALVFYRSAEWCLFCKFELKIVQRRLEEFQAAGRLRSSPSALIPSRFSSDLPRASTLPFHCFPTKPARPSLPTA